MNNDASFFPGQVTTFRYYKQAKGGNIILRIGYYYLRKKNVFFDKKYLIEEIAYGQ